MKTQYKLHYLYQTSQSNSDAVHFLVLPDGPQEVWYVEAYTLHKQEECYPLVVGVIHLIVSIGAGALIHVVFSLHIFCTTCENKDGKLTFKEQYRSIP
jgi:hypothetical protein